MKKIIKRDNIGWSNNSFTDEAFNESNNNWFILYVDDIYDIFNANDDTNEICDKFITNLKNDCRVIFNNYIKAFIVSQNNVDEVEQEYQSLVFRSFIDILDTNFGDWEQDYDKICKHFKIGEHQAYLMVGEHIEEVLENMASYITLFSEEKIKNLTNKQLEKLEYGCFSRYIYCDLVAQIKNIEDNYKDML